MRILEYTGLDTARVAAQYRKATEAIAREDFRAAEVKKLVNLGHGKFYRARLDGANRLLFALVRHGGETCALMLEVIANHDYGKSRFLRGCMHRRNKDHRRGCEGSAGGGTAGALSAPGAHGHAFPGQTALLR